MSSDLSRPQAVKCLSPQLLWLKVTWVSSSCIQTFWQRALSCSAQLNTSLAPQSWCWFKDSCTFSRLPQSEEPRRTSRFCFRQEMPPLLPSSAGCPSVGSGVLVTGGIWDMQIPTAGADAGLGYLSCPAGGLGLFSPWRSIHLKQDSPGKVWWPAGTREVELAYHYGFRKSIHLLVGSPAVTSVPPGQSLSLLLSSHWLNVSSIKVGKWNQIQACRFATPAWKTKQLHQRCRHNNDFSVKPGISRSEHWAL